MARKHCSGNGREEEGGQLTETTQGQALIRDRRIHLETHDSSRLLQLGYRMNKGRSALRTTQFSFLLVGLKYVFK